MNSVRALISPDSSPAFRSSTPLASNQCVGSPFLNAERKNFSPFQKNRIASSTDDFLNNLNNPQRFTTVAVVGQSGFQPNGAVGVGKSCLCNRFVRPWEDAFRIDHISTLSAVDFGGRIINNDHWLYWGDQITPSGKDGEETPSLQLRIIEHTEFTDDVSFQPFRSNSTNGLASYAKRCAVLKLQSPDKLMYICKDQLGLESDYEQKALLDGKASIDGFMCIYDVSQNSCSQIQAVASILQCLLKLKKPIVVVTTKADESNDLSRKSLEQLLNRREFRNLSTNLVETSSILNINVESAFLLLSHLVDKSYVQKPKIKTFKEALKIRNDFVNNLHENYLNLLSSEIQDSKSAWDRAITRLSIDSDYQKYVEVCGSLKAKFLYDQFLRDMKEKRAQKKLRKQIDRLPEILQLLTFELNDVKNRPWSSTIDILASSSNFENYFCPAQAKVQFMSQISQPKDRRLPANLLYTIEAETAFNNLLRKLEADFMNKRLRKEFVDSLKNCGQVTPGKSLEDIKIFLIGKECYEALDHCDLQVIYDQYQKQLIRTARRDFLELLCEQIEQFVEKIFIRPLIATKNETTCFGAVLRDKKHANRSPSMKGSDYSPCVAPSWVTFLTDLDLEELNELLREDFRYRHLNRLHQMRDHMIGQFANFVKYPLTQHCPAESKCIDLLTDDLLDTLASFSPSVENNANLCCKDINLLIIDADGMGCQFVNEARVFLADNEISVDGFNFRFNYDCMKPSEPFTLSYLNGLRPFDCFPDGVVYLFSCRSSLEKIESCLLKEAKDKFLAKILLLLACDPGNFDELPYLQQRGAQLSSKLAPHNDVPFVGLEPSHSHVTVERRATKSSACYFTDDQILQTLTHFCRSKLENSNFVTPDLNIALCFMCGDEFAPELILGPFLKHTINSTNSCLKLALGPFQSNT